MYLDRNEQKDVNRKTRVAMSLMIATLLLVYGIDTYIRPNLHRPESRHSEQAARPVSKSANDHFVHIKSGKARRTMLQAAPGR